MNHYGWDAKLGFSGEISTVASLGVIVGILVVTAIVSLARTRRQARLAQENA